MPTVDETVDGWIRHFASADRDLRWIAAEEELSIPLMPGVILAGRIDARLRLGAQGQYAFGEWKSMSKFGKPEWKEKWRFHPQSLTYGLLLRETHPEVDRFTIRVAFKSDPPTFDHEWFSYSAGEIATWRSEVQRIANDILTLQKNSALIWPSDTVNKLALTHWPLNPLSCYKYGPKYACPYVHACTHQEWDVVQPGAPMPYIPHLQVMRDAAAQPTPPLVLDATAITAYLECPEAFRRRYVRGEDEAPSEALQFGSAFHQHLDHYYQHYVNGTQAEFQRNIGGAATWPNQQNV